MKLTLIKHCNKVLEAANLLMLLAMNETIEEQKQKLELQYECTEKMYDKLNHLFPIIESIKLRLAPDMDLVHQYFTEIGGDHFCYGKQLLLLGAYNMKDTLQEQYDSAAEADENLRLKWLINQFNFTYIREDYDQIENREPKLFELLDSSNFTPEQKWQIQSFHYKPEEPREIVRMLLNKTLVYMEEHKDIISKLENGFYQYWSDYLKEKELEDFLKVCCNINLGNEFDDIKLIPNIFFYNTIYLTLYTPSEMKTLNKAGIEAENKIGIGILFSEEFGVNMKKKFHSDPCKDLKILSDKSKFDILSIISKKTSYGQELAQITNLSKPTVSHHMKVLLNAGFVKIVKMDNRIYYEMDKEKIEEVLSQVKKLLLD